MKKTITDLTYQPNITDDMEIALEDPDFTYSTGIGELRKYLNSKVVEKVDADFDNLQTEGRYKVIGTPSNAPTNSITSWTVEISRANSAVYQIASPLDPSGMLTTMQFTRRLVGDAWTAWEALMRAAHYMGQIFAYQSGAGIVLSGSHKCDGATINRAEYKDFYDHYLKPSGEVRRPLTLPKLTANVDQGFTVKDSRSNADAYQLVNGVKTKDVGKWATYSIELELSEAAYLDTYTITASTNGSVDYPTAWILYGSTGGAYEQIEQVVSQSFRAGEERPYIVNTDKKYKKYMLKFVSGVESSGSGSLGRIKPQLSLDSAWIASITFEQFDQSVQQYGYCARYALDTTKEQFKVPLIKDGRIYTDKNGEKQAENASQWYCQLANATIKKSEFDYSQVQGALENKANKDLNNLTTQAINTLLQSFNLDVSKKTNVAANEEFTVDTLCNVELGGYADGNSGSQTLFKKVGETFLTYGTMGTTNWGTNTCAYIITKGTYKWTAKQTGSAFCYYTPITSF